MILVLASRSPSAMSCTFPSNVTGQPARVRITCAATGCLLRCGSPRCRPLASGHRPSIPKTTACLGRFDDVELAEALCVCDHLDCDDLAVGNREGHDGGETRVRCQQDRRCAVDESGVGIVGPVRECERLPRYAMGPVLAGGGSAACCGVGANGDVGVEQVEQRSKIAVA